MKTTNKQSRDYAARTLEFTASNLRGYWNNDHTLYVVESYKWYPLFIFHADTSTWYENEDKYSVSTSRQTSQSRPTTGTAKVSLEMMKKIVAGLKIVDSTTLAVV